MVGSGRELVGSGRELVGSGRELFGSGRELVGSGRELVGSGRELVRSGRELLGLLLATPLLSSLPSPHSHLSFQFGKKTTSSTPGVTILF